MIHVDVSTHKIILVTCIAVSALHNLKMYSTSCFFYFDWIVSPQMYVCDSLACNLDSP